MARPPRSRICTKAVRLIAIGLFLLGLVHAVLGAGASQVESLSSDQHDEPDLKDETTWNIIAANSEKCNLIADLVFMELSSSGKYKFVNREELPKIAQERLLKDGFRRQKEQFSSNYFEIAKADRLILIYPDDTDKLKVLIVDVNTGSRLMGVIIPANDSPENIVSRIVDLTHNCRSKYECGVHTVVGVSPFKPRNLVHDYDHLSEVYKLIIESQLSSFPGVATMEVDEVRSLDNELSIAGNSSRQELTPVLVHGSYVVNGEIDSISFRIIIEVGGKPFKTIEKELPAKEVDSFLGKEVSKIATEIDLADVESIDPEKQFKWLIKQADDFSELGMHDKVVGLIEAALILRPKDAELRLRLISRYGKCSFKSSMSNTSEIKEESELFRKKTLYMSQIKLRKLEHIEYLIRNRLITKNQAMNLLGSAGGPQFHKVLLPLVDRLPGKLYIPNNKALFERRFMMSYAYCYGNLNRRTLKGCIYYFNEIMREDMPTSYNLESFFSRKPPGEDKSTNITEEEWITFLNKLKLSDHRIVQLLAEYGLLSASVWDCLQSEIYGNTPLTRADYRHMEMSRVKDIANRVKRLMDEWEKLPARKGSEREDEPLHRSLVIVLKKIEKIEAIRSGVAGNKSSSKKNDHGHRKEKRVLVGGEKYGMPADWFTNTNHWRRFGHPPLMGHLRFSKLNLEFKGSELEGNLPKDLRFEKGDDEIDFLWNGDNVWILSEANEVTPAIEYKVLPIKDVQWDGKFLWVLSGKQNLQGSHIISAYSRSGDLLGRLGEEDLSRNQGGLHMLVVDEGVLCVIGHLRSWADRSWIARVEINALGNFVIDEFFQAKYEPRASDSRHTSEHPDHIYRLMWMHLLKQRDPQSKWVLVGRRGCQHPLLVDMNNRTVSIYPYACGFADYDLFSHEGRMFKENPRSISVWCELGETCEKTEKYTLKRFLNDEGEKIARRIPIVGGSLRNGFFMHNGYLHCTGSTWIRIDLKTKKLERMTDGAIPQKWRMEWCASSAGHGLIGYNGQFWSVHFAEEHLYTDEQPDLM